MSAVDPLRNARVMFVTNQKREAEIVQQALDRAFPILLFRSHLKEFAGEGYVLLA